jgi:hypothetical protein
MFYRQKDKNYLGYCQTMNKKVIVFLLAAALAVAPSIFLTPKIAAAQQPQTVDKYCFHEVVQDFGPREICFGTQQGCEGVRETHAEQEQFRGVSPCHPKTVVFPS